VRYSPTAAADTITGLLAAAADAMAGAGGERPERVCLVPGAIAWDLCECGGSLLAAITGLFPSNTFPASAADTSGTPCGPPLLVSQIGMALLRCAPGPDAAGNPPTCAELDEAARRLLVDADAVRRAVTCRLRELYASGGIADYTVGQQQVLGPEGGCTGVSLEFAIGWVGGCCG